MDRFLNDCEALRKSIFVFWFTIQSGTNQMTHPGWSRTLKTKAGESSGLSQSVNFDQRARARALKDQWQIANVHKNKVKVCF